MKIISLIKSCIKDKNNKNPKLNEEDMKKIELVNKDVYESFKTTKKDGEVEVECKIKDGKYILAYIDENKEKKKIKINDNNKNEGKTEGKKG